MSLDDDLRQAAQRWRSDEDTDPASFDQAWHRVVAPASAEVVQHSSRGRRIAVFASVAATLVLLTGVAVAVVTESAGKGDRHAAAASGGPSSGAAPNSTTAGSRSNVDEPVGCGAVPQPGGSFAGKLSVELALPSHAVTGTSVAAKVRIVSNGEPIDLTDAAQPVELLLTSGNRVVARSAPQRGTGWYATITADGTPIKSAPLALMACGRVDEPVPAGNYQAWAVFRPDETSDLILISEPQPITVGE